MISKRKTNTSWNFWIAILQSEKKPLFHHVTNFFFFFLGAKTSKSGVYFMFTEHFDVDKLNFKSSITLHVAPGSYLPYQTVQIEAFSIFWHFWKLPIRTQITVIIWAAVTYSVSFTSQYWNLNLHPQYWVLDQRLILQAPQQSVSPV